MQSVRKAAVEQEDLKAKGIRAACTKAQLVGGLDDDEVQSGEVQEEGATEEWNPKKKNILLK